MEKLKSKTLYTIFSIISLFTIITTFFFNIQSYREEYQNILSNLIRMTSLLDDNRSPNKRNDSQPSNIKNRIIMDYNFYTILLDQDNNIIDKISHNESAFSDQIEEEGQKIIASAKKSTTKINCLYFSKISYSLELGKYLVIADTSIAQKKLLTQLIFSTIFVILFEILVYYVAKKITEWITKPVEDSFNRQKEFIANASHELKTPLAVITASIDCLEENKKNTKWINILKSESDRMNNLITRLLDLSKSENVLNKESCVLNDLSKIVTKRALVFESLAFENKVAIECNIEDNIMFKCSKSDIDELISIIIDNAIKHSFPNSKVAVNLSKVKNNIIIDIVNRGEEIPKDEEEKIFERFYRSDKSRNREAGRYGLGLAIAKNIVTNHGGSIRAFSQDGYTTFKIIFKNKEH